MNSTDFLYDCITDFQISNNLTEYPLDLPKLCAQKGWSLIPYDVLRHPHMLSVTNDGLSIYKEGKFYILYNKYTYGPRLLFTVAHEIGHILLGHHFLSEKEFIKQNDELERAADIFAANLLCPAFLISEFQLDVEDIQTRFGVSRQCAETRKISSYFDSKRISYGDSKFRREMIFNFLLYPPFKPTPFQDFHFVMSY